MCICEKGKITVNCHFSVYCVFVCEKAKNSTEKHCNSQREEFWKVITAESEQHREY